MKKSLLSLAAVALMMSACTQDVAELEGGNVVNYDGNVGVTAVMTPETRTAMTENVAGSLEITWVAEDAIGLTGEDSSTTLGENVQYTANSSAASTTFSCAEATPIKWGEGNHTFYAYYPYTEEGSDYTAVPASVPAVQEQSAAGNTDHLQPYSFLYASYETNGIPADGNIDLQFKSAFSVLELEVCAEAGEILCEGLIFRADDASEKVSASNVLVDLTDGSLDYTSATTSNEIRIDLGEGVTLNSTTPQKFYMLITPGHGGKRFSFYAVVGGKKVLLGNKGIPAAGLPAGRKAQLSLNVPVVDLSADGTANCYIVNKASTTYKFKATVMGNGATTTGITPSTIAPTKARLARTVVASQSYKGGTAYGSDGTMNKLILRNSVELKDGYIYFTTPETLCPGNAIIYATDNNDKVLWSWHMWVAPNFNPYENMLPTFMGSVVMDRNLGAYNNGSGDTENDLKASIGLGYQWGRKDPFLITNIGYTYGNYQTADGTIDETQHVCVYRFNNNWSDSKDMSKLAPDLAFDSWSDYVNYTIENPHAFIKGNGSNGYQWLSSAGANAETGWNVLWGNADYNRNAGAGVKTIYDPCPVGWRVGSSYDYGFFNIFGSDMDTYYHYDKLWRYNWDQTKTPITSPGAHQGTTDISQSQGYWVYGSKIEDKEDAVRTDTRTTYFPAPNNIQSLINYSGVTQTTGAHVQIATNVAVGTTSKDALRAYISPNGSSYFSSNGSTWEQQAAAVQVRCVKDATVTTSDELEVIIKNATDLSKNGTSNCYIVNKANTAYKFKATVQGNGKATAGITPATIAPKKAYLLWAQLNPVDGSDNTMTRIINKESIQLTDDGYVVFSTNPKMVNGNACIAVTDNSGKILWSWHLWCINGYNAESSAVTVTNTGVNGGFQMMDRNLGATGNGSLKTYNDYSNALGAWYQWGRKDPFLGIQKANGYYTTFYWQTIDGTINNIYTYSGPHYETVDLQSKGVDEAVAYTIANPMVFATGNASPYKWLDNSTPANDTEATAWNKLWGNISKKRDYGLGSKSIYDPCPVGWRVPEAQCFLFITSHGDDCGEKYTKQTPWKVNTATPIYNKAVGATEAADGIFSSWFTSPYGLEFYMHGKTTADENLMPIAPEDKTVSYFPAGGFLNRTSGKPDKYHNYGLYQCNNACNDNSARRMMMWTGDAGFAVGARYTGDYEQLAHACQVRCIKE